MGLQPQLEPAELPSSLSNNSIWEEPGLRGTRLMGLLNLIAVLSEIRSGEVGGVSPDESMACWRRQGGQRKHISVNPSGPWHPPPPAPPGWAPWPQPPQPPHHLAKHWLPRDLLSLCFSFPTPRAPPGQSHQLRHPLLMFPAQSDVFAFAHAVS